jgi:hypothetical protein
MKKMIEGMTGNYKPSAKVVDGTLILSLPDAISPIVWRMDLGHVKSSALEIRDTKEGTHVLTLKTPKNDVHDIAPFATKGQALRALMAVARAMETAQGQIRPGANAANDPAVALVPYRAQKQGGKWGWAMVVAARIVAVVIMIAMKQPAQDAFPVAASQAENAAPAAGGNETAGQPQSADTFLRNR